LAEPFLPSQSLLVPAVHAGKRIFMSNRRKSSRSTARFHGFESLESRQMMAGNFTANVVNNTLFINEAAGSWVSINLFK
jgi:hypothetical protein